jgi:hypothetical protein
MNNTNRPRPFAGEFRVTPDEFTLEATRFIVHADKVSFEFFGADGNGGAFTVSGVALKTENGTFVVKGVEPKYKTSISASIGIIEFLVVDIEDDEAGDAGYDRCRVGGVWREPVDKWDFSGTLGAFIPVS